VWASISAVIRTAGGGRTTYWYTGESVVSSGIGVRTGRAGRAQARPVIFHGPKRPMP